MNGSLRIFCMLSVLGAAANATMLPSLTGVDISGAFTYRYAISFGPGIKLDSSSPFGQFFTIYDFAGFNGSHSSPHGWKFIRDNDDDDDGDHDADWKQAKKADTDNKHKANLTWQYVGSPVLAGPGVIGDFSAQSTVGSLRSAQFVSQGTDASGKAVLDAGSVSVPSIQETPEPATGLLLGCGLVLLSLVSRRFLRS
jgi:hypothetical protein